MEGGEGNVMKIESTVETDDWRAPFSDEVRQNIVNFIVGNLRNTKIRFADPESLNRLWDIAALFEEQTFQNAKSKEYYLGRIYKKLEPSSATRQSTSSSQDPIQMSIRGDISHSEFSLSPDQLRSTINANRKQPNICLDTQKEIWEAQSVVQQPVCQISKETKSQDPFIKQMMQITNDSSSCIQPSINRHQLQQHIASRLIMLPNYRQPSISTQQIQSPPEAQSHNPSTQKIQQLVKKHGILDWVQMPPCETNAPKRGQLTLIPQTHVSMVQNEQNIIHPQPNILQYGQRPSHVLQQRGVRATEHRVQQTVIQRGQLHNVVGSKNQGGLSQRVIPQNFEKYAPMDQHQSAIDQHQKVTYFPSGENFKISVTQHEQKQLGPQSNIMQLKQPPTNVFQQEGFRATEMKGQAARLPTSTALQSMTNQHTLVHSAEQFSGPVASNAPVVNKPQSELANTVDWQDETYQNIQDMKRRHALYLHRLYCAWKSKCEKEANPQNIANYKNFICGIQKMLTVLLIKREDLGHWTKEKMDRYLQYIENFVRRHVKANLTPVENQAKTSMQSQGQTQISQLQQNRNDKHTVTDQTNLSANLSSLPFVSSPQHGVINTRPHILSSAHFSSGIDLEQRNVPKSLQRTGALQHTQQSHRSLNTANSDNPAMKHQNVRPPNLKQHVQPRVGHNKKQQQLIQKSLQINPIAIEATEKQNQTKLTGEPVTTSFQHRNQKSTPLPLSSAGTELRQISPTLSSVPTGTDKQKVTPPAITEKSKHPPSRFDSSQVNAQHQDQSHSPTIGEQQLSDSRSPLDRLLKAVEKLSPKGFSSAVNQIESVINEMDMIDVHGLNQPTHTETLKRRINAVVASDAYGSSASTVEHQTSDLDSIVSSRIKRQKIEPNHDVPNEIRAINKKFIETVVAIESTDGYNNALKDGEGTVVKCSYRPVAVSEDFRGYASAFTLMFQPLRLLIPPNYPNCSPIILDEAPDGSSKNPKDINGKVKRIFAAALDKLPRPTMTLEEMAKAWDVSARETFHGYAHNFGAKWFTSVNGAWETSLVA